MDYGCAAVNYTEVLGASYAAEDVIWTVHVRDHIHKHQFKIQACSIVNATGPFADSLNERNQISTDHQHLFSKGFIWWSGV